MKARTSLTPADLIAIERLKRVAERKCRTHRQETITRHPRCHRDDAHLLALIKPDLVPECPECGEVWKKE